MWRVILCFWCLFHAFQNAYTGSILSCLDDIRDVTREGWTTNADLKSAETTTQLPKNLGNLMNLRQAKGLWYFTGPSKGTGNEISFTSPANIFPRPKPKSIQMYIKYYAKSPRQVSVYPVKPTPGRGQLFLLPSSDSSNIVQWKEALLDLDPSQSEIDISAYFSSQSEFILFDKIVVSTSSLPNQYTNNSCDQILSSLTTTTPLPPWERRNSGSERTSSPNLKSSVPATQTTTTQHTNCPSSPDCKCNCICDCGNKC